ncbi:hypothetical protein H2866_23535 (plasmid) [Rouxiella badensis subsp. acadiensis]|nr:hypothetical protein H2866_23535 [Rouxiella badensis subsp. acadiensis]
MNPDKNVADKRVCDYLEGVPLKQRGEFSRNALFADILLLKWREFKSSEPIGIRK